MRQIKKQPDCLTPPIRILVALGSIAIHAEELLSPDGHTFDRAALETCLNAPGVRDWIKEMDGLAMLPVKRT